MKLLLQGCYLCCCCVIVAIMTSTENLGVIVKYLSPKALNTLVENQLNSDDIQGHKGLIA